MPSSTSSASCSRLRVARRTARSSRHEPVVVDVRTGQQAQAVGVPSLVRERARATPTASSKAPHAQPRRPDLQPARAPSPPTSAQASAHRPRARSARAGQARRARRSTLAHPHDAAQGRKRPAYGRRRRASPSRRRASRRRGAPGLPAAAWSLVARVDENGRTLAAHEEGVALAHVEHHDLVAGKPWDGHEHRLPAGWPPQPAATSSVRPRAARPEHATAQRRPAPTPAISGTTGAPTGTLANGTPASACTSGGAARGASRRLPSRRPPRRRQARPSAASAATRPPVQTSANSGEARAFAHGDTSEQLREERGGQPAPSPRPRRT